MKSHPPLYINGRFLGQRVTGIQRYAREVLLALDELLADEEPANFQCTILVPMGTPVPALRHFTSAYCGRFQGHIWEQLDLPWRSRDGFLFSFCPTGPVIKKRQVVTVHDASVKRVPSAFSKRFRLWYEWVVGNVVQRTGLTVTVSQFSAGELIACYGLAREKIRVTTEGWQHLDRLQADERIINTHGLAEKPFVLAVSSPTPNKNFNAIVQALAIMGNDAPCCVAAGAADSTVFRSEEQISSAIKRVGYVSDEGLKALYQQAYCFVFPSFYEGFGIPPLEAMASGCPVIASTAPAVKEVCGDAALYFDPNDPSELAARLRELIGNPDLRNRLSQAGIERASQYSWAKAARLNFGAMQEMMSLNS